MPWLRRPRAGGKKLARKNLFVDLISQNRHGHAGRALGITHQDLEGHGAIRRIGGYARIDLHDTGHQRWRRASIENLCINATDAYNYSLLRLGKDRSRYLV